MRTFTSKIKLFVLTVTLFATQACAKENYGPCTTCGNNTNVPTTTTVPANTIPVATTTYYAVPAETFPSYYTYDQSFPIYTGFSGYDITSGVPYCDLFNGVPTGSRSYWYGSFNIVQAGRNALGQLVVMSYTGQQLNCIVDRGLYQYLQAGSVFQLTQSDRLIASGRYLQITNPSTGGSKYYLDPTSAKKTTFVATLAR